MFIQSFPGDIWYFEQFQHTFFYQLRLTGNKTADVRTYQVQIAPPNHAHLCILHQNQELVYHEWLGNKWRKVRSWDGVLNHFQTTLDSEGELHLIIPFREGSRYFSYTQKKWAACDLPFMKEGYTPFKLYPWSKDNLIFIQEFVRGATSYIVYRLLFLPAKSWSEEKLLTALPPNHQDLAIWLTWGGLHLTYYVAAGRSKILHLFSVDSALGEIQERLFSGLTPKAGPSLLSQVDADLILMVVEPNTLICWRSSDGGRTWGTKTELPCPCPLRLAPVLNFKGEPTSLVSLEGFYHMDVLHPAIIETKQLLSFNSYGV